MHLAITHANIEIESKDDDVAFGTQILKTLFGAQTEVDYDDIAVINIPNSDWKLLREKYSVGDNFEISFTTEGIILKKL